MDPLSYSEVAIQPQTTPDSQSGAQSDVKTVDTESIHGDCERNWRVWQSRGTCGILPGQEEQLPSRNRRSFSRSKRRGHRRAPEAMSVSLCHLDRSMIHLTMWYCWCELGCERISNTYLGTIHTYMVVCSFWSSIVGWCSTSHSYLYVVSSR